VSDHPHDAVVIGSGPNGLAAAIVLAEAKKSVLVVEAADTIGGSTRTEELTLPGFAHDVCSAVHPTGVLSPLFRRLPLEQHGLRWIHAPISAAHPLDGGRAGILSRDFEETASSLGADGAKWTGFFRSFLSDSEALFEDLLAPPLHFPRQPFTMARFGWHGLRSVASLARSLFRNDEARALLAGCAGHSILPLTHPITAAVGMVFALSGHAVDWPVAEGGSHAITRALASYLGSLGGRIEVGRRISSLAEVPESRVVLFDTSPAQLLSIAGDSLPERYRRKLSRYRYGPAVFKLDWALNAPIPWAHPSCARASTVHVGGTLEEIATAEQEMWDGRAPEKPFLILCQQSHFDRTRAPVGKHTGYAYAHVPAGCEVDMTERIEAQIERFAPGFRDTIEMRRAMPPSEIAARNLNNVAGAITGGVADFAQFFARPTLRAYRTPNPRLFLCSASTPPGAGVHGMCGANAAQAALRRLS
jgi:phytoene dehydrogenase-like protein